MAIQSRNQNKIGVIILGIMLMTTGVQGQIPSAHQTPFYPTSNNVMTQSPSGAPESLNMIASLQPFARASWRTLTISPSVASNHPLPVGELSPDGRRLLTLLREDSIHPQQRICLTDLTTGGQQMLPATTAISPRSTVDVAHWDPCDAEYVIYSLLTPAIDQPGKAEETAIWREDVHGKYRQCLLAHYRLIMPIPDGKLLLVADAEKKYTITLSDLHQPQYTFIPAGADLFAPNGKLLFGFNRQFQEFKGYYIVYRRGIDDNRPYYDLNPGSLLAPIFSPSQLIFSFAAKSDADLKVNAFAWLPDSSGLLIDVYDSTSKPEVHQIWWLKINSETQPLTKSNITLVGASTNGRYWLFHDDNQTYYEAALPEK